MITVTDRQRSVEAQAEVWEESQEMNGNKGKICVNQSWMMGKKLKWEGGVFCPFPPQRLSSGVVSHHADTAE